MRDSVRVVGARRLAAAACAILIQGVAAHADGPEPIRDNSFLVEEAYNQEDGVIQHISTFARERVTGAWAYAFTQEWPVGGPAHQLSYTLIAERAGDTPGGSGLGDLAVNYRWMALGATGGRMAFAPRLSLLLPTGDPREGRGGGRVGVQVNLPLSVAVSSSLVLHSNAGVSRTNHARSPDGDRADVMALWFGQSAIWLARPWFNPMIEVVWSRFEAVAGPGVTGRTTSLLVAPGARFAINRPSGLQVVPGVAFPMEVGSEQADRTLLLYLSFEHPIHGNAVR